ncbi:NADH-ubiquinone oxidoreductase 40 kDa subunit [Uncinocarpus reesii 1704]|uniref:NADH-ubiquinone oxidoreductase 40 kDa subunit n=1 Tax=Uncinocarpus reesii (strain UAMH 1704) TaxID=336963 RepID=C4JSI9_UNCRE|nr:NADH-ubiquinone oxidoreductase 40 kDa subunit [Uncinocarpus reesii 1704]EEP80586.1 NADH-ubiquinone oxidoreductase 40 kDa subunit [Uncinocarpus reesii 1704]
MQKCRAVQGAFGSKAILAPPASSARLQPHVQKRSLQDIFITRTGTPIIKVQGGRYVSNPSTRTIDIEKNIPVLTSIFAFMQGCTVIVPFREEMTKRHLKVTGDLGRVIFTEFDLRNTQSIEESVRHSDVVYNLIGRDYPTK